MKNRQYWIKHKEKEKILYEDYTNLIGDEIFLKTAVLGITGVKKILLNVVNKLTNVNAKPFSNIEDAKDYLIE